MWLSPIQLVEGLKRTKADPPLPPIRELSCLMAFELEHWLLLGLQFLLAFELK